MICRQRKIIFIHIPKTGGTSIEDIIWGTNRKQRSPEQLWMGIVGPGRNKYQTGGLQHLLAAQVRREVGADLFGACFKFAVVRNPWDKAVSQYVYMKQRRDLRRRIGINRFSSFKTYLSRLHRFDHVQWMPQWRFLLDENGEMLMDFIGRFEDFEADVRNALAQVNIPCNTLPHEKKGKRDHYARYYDQESREMVAHIYAKDIELFGYSFESVDR